MLKYYLAKDLKDFFSIRISQVETSSFQNPVILKTNFGFGSFLDRVDEDAIKKYSSRWLLKVCLFDGNSFCSEIEVIDVEGSNWLEWIVFPVRICEITREMRLRFKLVWLVLGEIVFSSWYDFDFFNGVILKTSCQSIMIAFVEGNPFPLHSVEIKEKDFWLDKRYEEFIEKQHSTSVEIRFEMPSFKHPVLLGIKKNEFEIEEESVSSYDYTTNNSTDLIEPQSLRRKEFVIKNNCLTFDSNVFSKNPTSQMNKSLKVQGKFDKKAVPTKEERTAIHNIIRRTSLQEVSMEESELVWRYSYWLLEQDEKSSLVCVLSSVKKFLIDSNEEVKRRVDELLERWSDIEVHDGLLLISYKFKNFPKIRNYAVDRVFSNLSDDHLLSVLLQLVQSLAYEKSMLSSRLAQLLIERSTKSFEICSNLYWYLNVEIGREDFILQQRFRNLQVLLFSEIDSEFRDRIRKQKKLYSLLKSTLQEFAELGLNREEKERRIRQKFSEQEKDLTDELFPSFLSVDPKVCVVGMEVHDIKVFKSGTEPILIPFRKKDGKKYFVIFKIGDDLRQDQLVLQMITVMDGIFKKNALNLCLTPYNVIACDKLSGFIECVSPSETFHRIIYDRNISILEWLENRCGLKRDSKEFNRNVLERFVKSCAGYCVITLVLGIGDRHLDNILMRNSGEMFHIDFGLILGDENVTRKLFSPVIKLSKEMIETVENHTMGYQMFIDQTKEAYRVLRMYCRLFINMLVLMIDSQIEGVVRKEDLFTDKQFLKIGHLQEKLQLNMKENEAMQYLENKINENREYWGGKVVDGLHLLSMRYFMK